MKPWSSYSPLTDNTREEKDYSDDGTEDLVMPLTRKRRRIDFRAILIFAGGLTIGTAIALAIAFKSSLLTNTSNKPTPMPSRHGYHATKIVDGQVVHGTQCGDSWQEAKALGCIYDYIASRWYAPECYDPDAFAAMKAEPQVQAYKNWTWYADKEHTVEVPAATAMAGEFVVLYPLHDFHKVHCLYLWRKMHHALLNGLPLDDDLMEEHHTIHCTQTLMTWGDPHIHELATLDQAGRPFCRTNPLGIMPTELM